MRTFIFLFALLSSCISAVAADRLIGYIEQDKPGELIMVVVVQSGKKHVASIHDLRKGTDAKMRPISKDDFEALWSVFTGPEAAPYAFAPAPSDNMSDVGFYTVTVDGAKKPISLRIPKEQKTEAVSKAIAKIKAWIDEKG